LLILGTTVVGAMVGLAWATHAEAANSA
jgi:hypothetical protein